MKLSYISKFSLSVLKKTNYKIFIILMLLVSTLATVNVIEIAFAFNLTSSYTIDGSSSNAGSIVCIRAPCGPPSTDSGTGDSSINGSSSNAGSIVCIRAPCGPPSTDSGTGDSSIDNNKDSSSSLSSTISSPQLSTTITDDDNNNTK